MKRSILAAFVLVAARAATAATFFFPQCADGDGWSMIISISNLSSVRALGTLSLREPGGQLQTLPFESGPASEVSLDLAPNSTLILRTTGSSRPIKTGYLQLEVTEEQVSGVVVFKYGASETSVLPVAAGKKFSLFVERSAALETGMAFYRSSESPITLRLYDSSGRDFETLHHDFQGRQQALFLWQIPFLKQLPPDFTGVLVMESAEAFAPVGLRFGHGILSTIPVHDFRRPPAAPVPFYGLNFSPWTDGQDPTKGAVVSEAQLRSRMSVVAPFTRWIRTYGSTHGLEKAGPVAHSMGLKAAVGAWLSTSLAANEAELSALINVGKAGHADLVIVGSETLARRDLAEAQLIDYIRRVKNELPGIPVTTADTHHELFLHPAVMAECDVVLANYYPFWDRIPLDQAVAALNGWHDRLKSAAAGKTIIVSETGWPSCGDTLGGAVPTPENSASFLAGFLAWARAGHVDFFYFAAFDESWKAAFEGPQGACWGVWDKNGTLKPQMKASVSP